MDSREVTPKVGLVKGVVAALTRRGVYLTTTRAQKLLYLVERQHLIDTGDRCFFLDYRHDEFGMYSPRLNRILLALDSDVDHLRVDSIVSERGAGRSIRWIGGKEPEPLPETVEIAVAKVLSRWGFLDTPTLIEVAKATSPFVHARKGEVLDWENLADELCDEEERLSEQGLRRLTIAERTARRGKSRSFDDPDEVIAYLFDTP